MIAYVGGTIERLNIDEAVNSKSDRDQAVPQSIAWTTVAIWQCQYYLSGIWDLHLLLKKMGAQ